MKRFFIFTTAATGLLVATLIALTPPGVDDLLFLIPAKGHEPGPGLWGMMTGEFQRIWQTQTGRLGNFIAMPFLYLMPKWIFGIITGVLTSLLILLSCRLTRSCCGSIVSWLLYASIILAYPWYDFLTMTTYAVNYVWAATAAAGAAFCFLNIDYFTRIQSEAAFLLMFIAGWMHEGFGAPLTAGLLLSLMLHRPQRGTRRILALICVGVGTCMTALSPTFWSRSGQEMNLLLKYPYKELVMNIGPALTFLAALAILTIWMLTKPRLRRRILMSSPAVIFITAAAVSTAVYLKYYTGPRTAAPAILFSMLACGYLLTEATVTCTVRKQLLWVVGILIGGFTLIHLAYADCQQIARSREYKEVTRLYEASADGVFYYDLTYPKADLSLFKTTVRQLHERVPKEFMRMYYNPEHRMVILPTSMKGFVPDKALKSKLTPEAMIYNGWIVLPDSIDTESIHRIHILTEDGRYLPSRFRIDRFACPGYGDFKILTPHIKVLDCTLEVKDVSLHDDSR